ncbi:molybdate-anion transporter-like [Macrosteles quadrilineatus]|uniref:molybdate-anion transporter-like n=1 Tax=Macrosteles quadrilineatus TaxID=74068 RepID=UPI0023E2327B|nr:molybdate-anion transporter-like [Macrosteles quadrilineatus]
MIFIVVLCGLGLTAALLFNRNKKTHSSPKSLQFERLQKSYLTVYYLATFSDWLQGPYVYKLYSDYGYKEEEIAFLYIAGFGSSSIFGALIGHIADKYGRKKLCMSFGFFYSICNLTKIFSNFYILLLGRVFGGISTSILFSTFEAWYINEHINHHNLPPEWLNNTFSKAGSVTGFLAIVAGILSQICAETLGFGPVSPFLLAIPFLFTSSYLIAKNWKEHSYANNCSHQSCIAPLYHIFVKDPILLVLGLIQSLFESVMYTFIFSWTPIISDLNPPLGIVFASFMLAFMIGSKVYSMSLSDTRQPQYILVLTSSFSFANLCIVSLVITYSLYSTQISTDSRLILTQVCFVCFILYEFSVGLYVPVISYLKSRVIPEEHRASIANWFRVPMNIFTCISLTLNQFSDNDVTDMSKSIVIFKKFHLIYILSSVFLLITTLACVVFNRKYTRKLCWEESFNEPSDTLRDIELAKDKL